MSLKDPRTAQRNVELLRTVEEAFNRRDLETAIGAYDPAAEWQMAREDPDTATLHGAEAITRLWESWLESYPDLRVEAQEVIPAGDRVFVWVQIRGRGAASGAEVEQEEAYVYTFSNGKITRVEEYFDRQEGLEAAGVRR
jgi:ketosteroid isomerase-like protein